MSGFTLGFAIESLVAVLLAVTIGYCVLVNRKLSTLRSDQSELKSIVRELHRATDQAAQAIAGLRQSTAAAEESLGGQLDRVKMLDKQLRESIERGDALVAKLSAMPRASEVAASRSKPDQATQTRAANPGERDQRVRQRVGLGLLNAQGRTAARNDEAAA